MTVLSDNFIVSGILSKFNTVRILCFFKWDKLIRPVRSYTTRCCRVTFDPPGIGFHFFFLRANNERSVLYYCYICPTWSTISQTIRWKSARTVPNAGTYIILWQMAFGCKPKYFEKRKNQHIYRSAIHYYCVLTFIFVYSTRINPKNLASTCIILSTGNLC